MSWSLTKWRSLPQISKGAVRYGAQTLHGVYRRGTYPRFRSAKSQFATFQKAFTYAPRSLR